MGKRKKPSAPLELGRHTKVGALCEASPAALEAMIEMGFEPLRNRIARKTVARLFTLEQAAAFRGVDLDQFLATLARVVAEERGEELAIAAPPEGGIVGGSTDGVPALSGDVRVVGLVPCPVRAVLIERFDAFVQQLGASSGTRVGWWLAGEGPATGDVRRWLEQGVATGDRRWLPEVLIAVGTELFVQRRYGQLLEAKVFGPFPGRREPRADLAALEDPTGVLGLQFAVPFVLSCRPDRLPRGRVPRSWEDLADPAFKGEVALPSLDLPIIPDLLAALHAQLGEDAFLRLAGNVSTAMHPAQASPRKGRQAVPAVMILPLHFARAAQASEAQMVVPDEGPVAIPGFAAVRRDATPEAAEVASFLCSETYLRPLWELGSFVPNCRRIEAPLPGGRVVTRPWRSVLDGDPEALSSRLLAAFQVRP